MENQRKIIIGLFGFGVVGEGLYQLFEKTPSLNAQIKKVCIKNATKNRNAPAELFTTDKEVLLQDPEINVIVEVIDDTQAAFEIASKALLNGKDVVSASKKMLAENFTELLALQKQTGKSLLYEAAVCASIPIIRNLEEYYDNDLLHSFRGIVNGSTNFILSKMFTEGLEFKQALVIAQQLGFAESDPKLDVDGFDANNKLTLLLAHAYGVVQKPSQMLFTGIQNIKPLDAVVAKEKNEQIKLVAQAKKLRNNKIAAFVLPQFKKNNSLLAFIQDEFNGVVVESGFADKQFFFGKGAGSFPTASAVLSDISALRYNYKYEYRKLYSQNKSELSSDVYMRVYVSFEDWASLPKEKFEWIEEWHSKEKRNYLIGVIAYKELMENDWWRQKSISLILTDDQMIEDVELRKLKRKAWSWQVFFKTAAYSSSIILYTFCQIPPFIT